MAKQPQTKATEGKVAGAKKRQQPKRKTVATRPDNARTLLAGRQKTMEFDIAYKSDLMNRFLTDNGRRLLNTFERLAAIYRMAASDKSAYNKIKDWHQDINLAIAATQLDALEEQRQQKIIDNELNIPDINTPSNYKVLFEVSHPVTHTIINLVRAVDAELTEIEAIFLGGGIDDLEYRDAQRQALSILNGVIDRILKVTSPGRREGGAFSKELYMRFLKDPKFDLAELTDMPLEMREQLGLIKPEEAEKAKQEKAKAPKEVKAKAKAKPKTKATKEAKEDVAESAEETEEAEVA